MTKAVAKMLLAITRNKQIEQVNRMLGVMRDIQMSWECISREQEKRLLELNKQLHEKVSETEEILKQQEILTGDIRTGEQL